jgi:hypothetical protein
MTVIATFPECPRSADEAAPGQELGVGLVPGRGVAVAFEVGPVILPVLGQGGSAARRRQPA